MQKEEPPQPLPAGWIQLTTPDGKAYYQNQQEQTTQWTRPEAPAAPPPFDANATTNTVGAYAVAPHEQQTTVYVTRSASSAGSTKNAMKQATCMCGSAICGIINLALGIVAWILVIIAVFLVTPWAQIVAVAGILIFLISNGIAACVGGLCGGSCCSNGCRIAAWVLFGTSCVAALTDIVLSLYCYGDCNGYRYAGAVIGTLFLASTICFVVDNCNNARNINDVQDEQLKYKLLAS